MFEKKRYVDGLAVAGLYLLATAAVARASDVSESAASTVGKPLSSLATAAELRGITFHAISIDFLTSNPSVGLVPGHVQNSLYNILGFDIDLSRFGSPLAGSLHYETTIFALNRNFDFLAQTGDSAVGYQGTYNKRTAVLSVATYERTFGPFDLEFGRTHPNRYYAAPLCQSLDSCFQDILYYNAGFTSPLYSVWGGNLLLHATPAWYVEAGAFSTNDGARIGYDLGQEKNTGVLLIGEVGHRTTFDQEAYPVRYALTGFFNTVPHTVLNATSATAPATTRTQTGTSGLVLQGQKIVWRADRGLEHDPAPTSIALYGSAGTGLDSTTPILADVYVGATLQAPFAGRPLDRYGVKFNWERINSNYAQYLAAANGAAGGSGAPYRADKYIFEANAHIQLPGGLAFEPVVQYVIHPNSFYNPASPARAKDGVFAIGTLVIPLGSLLGLSSS